MAELYRFTKKKIKLLRNGYNRFSYVKFIIFFLTSFTFFLTFISHHQPTSNSLRTHLIPQSQSNLISELNAVSIRRPNQGPISPNSSKFNDLKIYIYELPPKYNADWLSNNRCSNHLFASEVAIHNALMKSNVRTFDPSDADFFFVPVYVSCNFSTGNGFPSISHARALLSSAVELISSELPYWNRSGGSDHVFVAAHDHGACFHAMEDAAVVAGVPEFMKKSIVLQTFGVKDRHPCQEVEHVVIPPYVSPEMVKSTLVKSPVNGRRDVFVFFRGKMEVHPKNVSGRFYGRRVRTEILQKYGKNRRFHLKRHRFVGYQTEIARSVFCLCPRGWAPWSPRLVEAAVLGCVPVIIADGIRLPFESAVPWPEISLTVLEKDIGKLAGILDHVAATNLSLIQKRLWDPKVRQALLFNDELVDGDATWHILVALSESLSRSNRRKRVWNE